MRIVKLIISMILVLFLSGCTASYTLELNDNKTVTEKVDFIESVEVINVVSMSVNGYLKEEYQLVRNEKIYNDYTMRTYTEGDNAIGSGEKEYKNFDNFKNNSIIVTEMFKDISINKVDDIIEIDMKPVDEFRFFESNTQYTSLLDKVEFKITLPYKVLDGNYDRVIDNTYIWDINKNANLKEINIKYKDEFIILKNISPAVYILATILGIILFIVLITYIRYKKNNRY